MNRQSVPDYLNRNRDGLNKQWNAILQGWNTIVSEHPTESLLHAIPDKIDAITQGGLKREGIFTLGGHQYNSSSISDVLKRIQLVPGSNVSLEHFIKLTITPVAATGPDDTDIYHIKLYVTNDNGNTLLLNQAEINWFFTNVYNPHNLEPIMGLLPDPQGAVVTVRELIYIYNAFFKPKHTRSGNTFSIGGKTIKRRKAQRVTKMSHRRFSSKRTTRYSNRRHHRTRTRRN